MSLSTSIGAVQSEKLSPDEPAKRVAEWLRYLKEPGQITELRALHVQQRYGRPQTVAGFFDFEHMEHMAKEALQLDRNAKGVYFTLNPVNPDLLARRCNRVEVADSGLQTADKDILRRRWLLVDADPQRVAGVSSTDAEKALSLEVIRAVREHLVGKGWSDPIMADSGNGHHLLYGVDLPADDGGTVQRVLQALAHQFNTDAVKIDTSVYNPARICKLYGTLSRKGDHTPERPHRRSCLMEVP
jgi:hypothetical protein